MASTKLAFVMAGLPARGKTYTARKLARYLSWTGHKTRVFNVGSYRREHLGSYQPHSFFDPANQSAADARRGIALLALEDMASWLTNEGEIAIYDATDSTKERRALIRNRLEAMGAEVFFIESICDDPSIIEANIRQTKTSSPDYKGMAPDDAVSDFRMRLAHYERSYEPVSEEEGSFIKVIDAGRKMVTHRIHGYIPARIVFFLLNVHIAPRSIWMTRHGESEYNVLGRIGGDSPLSAGGRSYARTLGTFVRTHFINAVPPVVWTSTLRRTVETGQAIGLPVQPWKALDEIDAGDCDSMTYEEIAQKMPAEYSARAADKFRYRYPRGESYQDVISRLEPVIFEIERERSPVIIIGHQAVLRALYAYMMDSPPEVCPRLPVPLHTLIELTPNAYGCEERHFELPPEPSDREGFRQTDIPMRG